MKAATVMSLIFLFCTFGAGAGTVLAGDSEKQVQSAVELVDLLSREQFEEAAKKFNQQMSEALPAKKLAETWKMLQKQVGAYEKRDSSRVEKSDQYVAVLVRCKFAKADLDTQVVFDSEMKVAGLFFTPAK